MIRTKDGHDDSREPVELGRRRIGAADIAAIAAPGVEVRLADEAVERAASSYAYAQDATRTQHIYGRTTGVGANRGDVVDDLPSHAAALLHSHATAAGQLRSPRRVRATLGVRLNQLGAGGSGVTPVAMSGLVEMLNRNSLPAIRDFGSIGTGDLPALAAVALALCGATPLDPGLPPNLISAPQDLISVMNSNAATIGDAALAHHDLSTLARGALRVAGLTFTAVDGNPQAFDEVIDVVTPLPGVAEVCRRMRSHIGDAAAAPTRVQDPYALRALPQVHGAFLDTLDRLDEVITALANAPAENPLFLPGAAVAHHAGFYAAHLVQALDAVLSAATQAAQLSLARLALLVSSDYTGLAPFLAVGPPGSSGVMILEYLAGSALVRLRAFATPSGLQTLTISRGAEEDASCASEAALHTLGAVEAFGLVVACEMVAAVRALRLRGRDPAGPFAALSHQMDDADLTADISTAQHLLAQLA